MAILHSVGQAGINTVENTTNIEMIDPLAICSIMQPDIIKLRSLFQTKTADELRHRTQSGTFGFGIERLPYGRLLNTHTHHHHHIT